MNHEDSLYHEFDQAGNRHMEYVNDRGEHADIPYDDIIAVFKQHYPNMVGNSSSSDNNTKATLKASQWDEDVARENQ